MVAAQITCWELCAICFGSGKGRVWLYQRDGGLVPCRAVVHESRGRCAQAGAEGEQSSRGNALGCVKGQRVNGETGAGAG